MTDEQLKRIRTELDAGLAIDNDDALALLDMVEELKLHIDLHVEQKAALNTDKEIFKARAMAAEEELRGHTQGGWISVEERLPEDGVKVLLWRRQADSWDNDKHIYYGDYREGRGLRHDGAGGSGWHAEYSHWQPLLAAPPETKTAGELRGDLEEKSK